MPFAPLPTPRGPLTEWLVAALERPPHDVGTPPTSDDPLTGDDHQLALHLCYELHYRGLTGVDERWEWEPSLLKARALLEAGFLEALPLAEPVGDALHELDLLLADATGPSLSSHIVDAGTLSQMREFAVHRSAYQLKEADPHTWALPRLDGAAKAAMTRIQADEYGDGDPSRIHSVLFAQTMRALGLDPTYGRYVELLPGITLATGNLVTMFGLHRRLRGACVGHLAAFEMTSVVPMSRYAAACDRFGLPPVARRFYETHVAADALHELVARGMITGLLADEPALAADVVWGARCLMDLEDRLTRHLLDAWRDGATSLLAPVDATAVRAA